MWRALMVVGASAPLFLPVLARRTTHLRLEMCPKCKERFYDLTNGICYSCGYQGWGLFRPEEAPKKPSSILRLGTLLGVFVQIVIIGYASSWIWKKYKSEEDF